MIFVIRKTVQWFLSRVWVSAACCGTTDSGCALAGGWWGQVGSKGRSGKGLGRSGLLCLSH